MSLCFTAAFDKKRKDLITEAEYLSYLVAHFGGVRHPEDSSSDGSDILWLRRIDPFGSSIRRSALSAKYDTLTDTSAIYEVFWNCLAGNLERFDISYTQLKKLHSSPNLVQPVAVLAALKRRTNILQYIFERGAVFDDDVDSAIQSSSYVPNGLVLRNYQWDVPLLNFLWQHDWKEMRTSPTALRDLAEPRFDAEALRWFLDHGAKLGSSFVSNLRDPPAAKVQFLVDQLGVDAFKESGVLNEAAIKGRTNVIKVLLDAGICIVDTPPKIDIREGGPSTALHEAVRNKHLQTITLLLDRGSPIGEATVEAAKRQGGDIADLIGRYTVEEGALGRKLHICNPATCDSRGRRRRGLGQGNAESPSFSYLFGN